MTFEEIKYRVYQYLLTIPKGRVVTYGQVAEAIGGKRYARIVGNALHGNEHPDVYPCFRVVNSKGELAKNFGTPGGIDDQRRRLEQDGIEVVGYRVDLKRYRWQ